MKIQAVVCMILFIISYDCRATPTNVDSFVMLLGSAQLQGERRMQLLYELADVQMETNADEARTYAEEAFLIATELDDTEGICISTSLLSKIYYSLGLYEKSIESGRTSAAQCESAGSQDRVSDALFNIGRSQYVLGRIDTATIYYREAWEYSRRADYAIGKAKAAKGLGDIHERNGEYPQAMEQYQLCLSLSQDNDFMEGQLMALNAIGIIHEYTGNTDQALAKYLETLKLAEEVGDIRFAGRASGNMGSLYFIQKNYDKAIEYAQKALGHYKAIDYQRGIAFVHQDMGQTLKAQGKLEEALKEYQAAEKIRIKLDDKRGLSFTYFGMGYTYKHLGDIKKARQYHEKSLALREEIGFKGGVSSSLRTLGKLNMEAGDYTEAYPYLKRSIDWSLEANDAEGIYEASDAMVEYYEGVGDFKKAFEYQKLHLQAKDSLFNADQNKQFADMQTLYETEKKEKQILNQEKELLELEQYSTKIETQRNYIMAGSLALGLLSLFGFQWNKVRKDRNSKREFAEALIFAQEEERKRLARDLHDGVGQSLLLIKKQLESSREISLENQNLISNTLQEVRSISQDLHPFQLEKFGFTVAVENMVEKIGNATDLFVSRELDNIDDRLKVNDEINAYRTIQEALSNIVKHSKATAAKVTIEAAEDESIIKIQDNGQGFDHELAMITSKSLGLRTMQERIANIGGKFRIESQPSSGTTIYIAIPVTK